MTSHAADRRRARTNPVDRFILRGRDPDRPVSLLTFERLRYALLAAVLLAVLGAGVISWAGQQKAQEICRERNRNAVVYRDALQGLSAAALERGDARSAAIFKALTPPANLPEC